MSILQTTELKKYYGSKPNITKALDGVTLSIEDGEFVAIVGTSGSGKSTLLNMMGGLDTPTSGSIKVKGKELSKFKDGKKENTDPEVRDHYIERNPVLQNQDYGCRWQRVEFVCRYL